MGTMAWTPRDDGANPNDEAKAMTGDESRSLTVDTRVRWGDSLSDRGTVVVVDWSGVTIKWDDGHTNHIQHNDMGDVTAVPSKLV